MLDLLYVDFVASLVRADPLDPDDALLKNPFAVEGGNTSMLILSRLSAMVSNNPLPITG